MFSDRKVVRVTEMIRIITPGDFLLQWKLVDLSGCTQEVNSDYLGC